MIEKLIQLRLTSNGDVVVGNDEEALRSGHRGWSRTLIVATVDSYLKSVHANEQEQRAIAQKVEAEDYLDYETIHEEVKARFGRGAMAIIAQEGKKAYAELKSEDEAPDSVYLQAAVEERPVREVIAGRDGVSLDDAPIRLFDGEQVHEIGGGWKTPPLLSATAQVDGEEYEVDLREHIPDLKTVADHSKQYGIPRRYRSNRKPSQNLEAEVDQFLMDRSEAEGALVEAIFNTSDGLTTHIVDSVEESIVEDESDRVKCVCGAKITSPDNRLQLMVDKETVNDKYGCGNCMRFHGD